jgi:hypothetical protein|nr:MAG TPA: Fibritin C-terminal region [Caudoviricetes sp.]
MAWTEQDLREIEDELKKGSQGVGDVPEAESLDGITSLPAYQEVEGQDMPSIVRAPLELLAAPALDAADKANAAATEAESNATAAQTAANTANEKAELAAQAASDANAAKEGAEVATQSANNAASNANEKAVLADTAAANANDTAEHPTYIGTDHYVYKWNKTAQAYDKTDIYTKGDAFSIKKVYASVANMEADKSNPDITEGDFVLVNTGDVEDPDNAKLYVKADGDFEFLVDMSGAIGFTGKTPQFSMGTVTTLEAGASATATVSSDGTDEGGNPKYKLNFAIPRGNPGAPFRVSGEYATLEALKSAVPDGSAVDGFMAVGTEAPYDYYAWVNGDWANQGKIAGGGSGNVVVIPAEAMRLTSQSTSDEILNAFGGKDAFLEIAKKAYNEDVVVVVPVISSGKVSYISSLVMASYTDNDNASIGVTFNAANSAFSVIITLSSGNATYAKNEITLLTEAPSNGNAYGRKNGDWVKVPEKSDVLTKGNETEYTPTKPYQPATKKYVDEHDVQAWGIVPNLTLDNLTEQQKEKLIEIAESNKNLALTYYLSYEDNGNYIEEEYDAFATRYFYCQPGGSPEYYYTGIVFNGLTIVATLSLYLMIEDGVIYAFSNSVDLTRRKLVTSDNLTTITKKTATEYEAIGSKDANTAYCVTD